jgi:hypothetical protein
MAETIQDGTGKGYTAKVDSENRLEVTSVSTQAEESASSKGFSYNINTGIITLTNATKTPVLYIKNNEVVGIKEREIKNIIGILYLDSKIKLLLSFYFLSKNSLN